ncbi:MAG TPA: phosphate signaling complex protein PhoU, partial [Gammaproteobacteria bacterium]|nr:phosphate signaling complex protein PhoU [Gammaproteobacteria bacterium]
MTEAHSGHTVQSFDQDLKRLTAVLLEMGELAVRQVLDAASALLERDDALAREVIAREKDVNAFDTRGEEMAIQVIAKRQPMGVDLRSVIVMLKSFTELERVGDEAKKIAKIARRMIVDEADPVDAYRTSFSRMVAAAEKSLVDVLQAVREQDENLAIRVAEGDKLLDLEYKDALRAIHEGVVTRPTLLPVAAEAVLIIKAIERVGDHAKNMAKLVVYQVAGRDVRHVKSKRLAEALGKT